MLVLSGLWSASASAGDRQDAAPKKEARVAPKKATTSSLGPWSACLLGTPTESRSQSRSQGVDDSKALGPWRSEASQKRQAASQGVGDSKALGPWSEASQKGQSAQQKRTATSYQSTPPKKAPRVDLTQACVMDIPHHVRGHAAPVSKKAEMAKGPQGHQGALLRQWVLCLQKAQGTEGSAMSPQGATRLDNSAVQFFSWDVNRGERFHLPSDVQRKRRR